MILRNLYRVSPVITRSALHYSLTVPAQRTLYSCQMLRTPVILANRCRKSHEDVPPCPVQTYSYNNAAQTTPKGILGSPIYNKQCLRFYNKHKTVRIAPTKPLSFDYSGDLVTLMPPVDPNAPKPGFEEVEELKSANSDVKDIFSMAFADGTQVRDKRLNELLVTIQEHPADIQSLEVKIARTTLLLRNMMRHVFDFRKDKVAKSLLVRRINRRNRNLRLLRTYDMEKFEWLLKQLKIKYVPERTYKDRPLSKRKARKKAARDAFFATKKEKMGLLRARLDKERIEFEMEKEEELSRITKELEEMGITEVDSVDSVLKAIGMEKYMDIPEKRMKRRYEILNKKFALWEEREKAKKQQTNVE